MADDIQPRKGLRHFNHQQAQYQQIQAPHQPYTIQGFLELPRRHYRLQMELKWPLLQGSHVGFSQRTLHAATPKSKSIECEALIRPYWWYAS